MTFVTSLTQKGQVTIPKKMREKAGLKPRDIVRVEQGKNGTIKITSQPTILDLAGTLVPRKNKNKDPLEAREYMENNYERV